MTNKKLFSCLAAFALGSTLSACSGVAYTEDAYVDGVDEFVGTEEFASLEQDLTCAEEQFSDNRLLAAFAVAAGKDLDRWEANDFERYTKNGRTYLRLSRQGRNSCDNNCTNTKAILAMQYPNSDMVPNHNPETFRQYVVSYHDRQQTWDRANSITAHKFTGVRSADSGGCGLHFWFRVKKTNGRNYGSESELRNKMQMFGYPVNPWLEPKWNRYEIAVDPSGSMTSGGTSSSGSCTVGSPVFDASRSSENKCCVYEGRTGRLKQTPFSSYIYTCEY